MGTSPRGRHTAESRREVAQTRSSGRPLPEGCARHRPGRSHTRRRASPTREPARASEPIAIGASLLGPDREPPPDSPPAPRHLPCGLPTPPAAFPVGRARRGAEAVPRGAPAPPHRSPCAPPPHQKRRRGFLWGVAGRLSRPFLRAPGRGGPARRRLPRRVHPAGRSSPRAPSPSPSGLGNGLQVGREDDAFFGHQIPRW